MTVISDIKWKSYYSIRIPAASGNLAISFETATLLYICDSFAVLNDTVSAHHPKRHFVADANPWKMLYNKRQVGNTVVTLQMFQVYHTTVWATTPNMKIAISV